MLIDIIEDLPNSLLTNPDEKSGHSICENDNLILGRSFRAGITNDFVVMKPVQKKT